VGNGTRGLQTRLVATDSRSGGSWFLRLKAAAPSRAPRRSRLCGVWRTSAAMLRATLRFPSLPCDAQPFLALPFFDLRCPSLPCASLSVFALLAPAPHFALRPCASHTCHARLCPGLPCRAHTLGVCLAAYSYSALLLLLRCLLLLR
jgi:hypothetical protein